MTVSFHRFRGADARAPHPDHRPPRRRRAALIALLSLLLLAAGAVVASAKGGGGTAKPPTKGVVAPNPIPTLPDPAFSVAPALIRGFRRDRVHPGCDGERRATAPARTWPSRAAGAARSR